MTIAESSDTPQAGAVQSQQQRYIATQLGQLTLLFPSRLVTETLLIERSRILALPFYDSAVLGCFHHAGQLVPLVVTHQVMGMRSSFTREVLTVVRLSEFAENFAGLGLIVDRVLGSRTEEQLPSELFETQQDSQASLSEAIQVFQPQLLNSQSFQPQRWQS
jgi:chemotaxis signal transduction protein